MVKHLEIAADLSLPIDAITETIAILAKRRVGKSYTARRLAEQIFRAGQQVVLVDPKGDHWGIKSAADGKAPGLPIVILGGERGDVPLESSGGELVARLVVEQRVSALIDLSLFRKHEIATFMTAFLENLYRMKAKEVYRTPMMLILDEADAIAPQKPQKGEERMLGAAEDIVRRGGQRGIGCTLVTQRSAVLNKNLLTQSQMIVALRTVSPQDLAAMHAWIEVHGTPEEAQELMTSLPSLPKGDAWFWSPGWPTTEGIFKRVHVLPIETFDSGATPKAGETRVEPKRVADVDLASFREQMAATIERAKENDPKELKRTIADLRKQLAAKPTAAPKDADLAHIRATAKREANETWKARFAELEGAARKDRTLIDRLRRLYAKAAALFADLGKELGAALPAMPEMPKEATAAAPSPRTATPQRRDALRIVSAVTATDDLTPSEADILAVAAQFPAGATRKRISVLSGRSIKSSSFQSAFPSLETKGLLVKSGAGYAATDRGKSTASAAPLPDDPKERLSAWLQKLLPSEQKVLRAIANAYPDEITRDEVAAATGQSIASSSFQSAFPALRGLELIHGVSAFVLDEDLAS